MTAARHRPWYAHAGTTGLLQPASSHDEEAVAVRLLADVEHELGDHVAAHLAHPDPHWILGWHRFILRRVHGVVFPVPEPDRRRPQQRRRRRAA